MLRSLLLESESLVSKEDKRRAVAEMVLLVALLQLLLGYECVVSS